jgi:hypothetical protein
MAGLIRRALSTATATSTHHDREEQGFPPISDNKTDNGAASTNDRPLTIMTIDASALVPAEDKLLIFRTLTGIDTVPAVSRAGHTVREGPNIGIYPRVVRAETRAHSFYSKAALVINFCLGFQVIIAATLTALGAANASYTAITGLGAINTIIAGIITYVKGAGLPNRFKYQESEWRKIREYIEQRERELCLANASINVYEEVRTVEDMYHRVKADLDSDKTAGVRSERSESDVKPKRDIEPQSPPQQGVSAKRPESYPSAPPPAIISDKS